MRKLYINGDTWKWKANKYQTRIVSPNNQVYFVDNKDLDPRYSLDDNYWPVSSITPDYVVKYIRRVLIQEQPIGYKMFQRLMDRGLLPPLDKLYIDEQLTRFARQLNSFYNESQNIYKIVQEKNQ